MQSLTDNVFLYLPSDDMIKSRRTSTPKKAAVKVSTGDKQVAKGRAARQAAANNRRGISATKKPSAMDIEKEVYRQTRRSTSTTKKQSTQPGRKPRTQADLKTKARNEKKKHTGNKKQQETPLPPTWIGGTRRPPSRKAVTAAVDAMTGAGFKVPKGMQMVISFAPAPMQDPTVGQNKGKKQGGNNNDNNNNNNNKGKNQGGGSNNNSNYNSRGGGRGNNNSGGGGGRGYNSGNGGGRGNNNGGGGGGRGNNNGGGGGGRRR
jgi:hypothetical protein